MYKRLFISASICLLFLTVGFQHVSAQSQLAQDTYAIFETRCFNCHGPDGSFRETLLIEHNALIEGGTVVPGNPDASELYKRLLAPTENGAQMPLGQEPLPPQSVDTIRRWIVANAPDWAVTLTTDSRFISPAEILDSIETHLIALDPFDRAFARYFTLTHLYNAGETGEILGEYRKALSKLVNSLSWDAEITNPEPIDPHDTIYYINLRDYEWDRNDGWTKLENEYPYHISFDTPAHTALRKQLTRLQTQMECVIPSVHIDWFIAAASAPPLYHDLLSLPSTDSDLEFRLEVDVTRNITNAPGARVWRAGFNNSGVSNHNRVVERHKSRYGAYWKSYDFAGSVGTKNIFTNPLGFTHDGGEVIFNLPNGLQGYYLVDGNGSRLDEAPINIVSNPAASDPTVRNGISCIGCHTEGMKTFEDEVRATIESNANPPYNKAQALRLYVEQSVMDARVSEDMETYRVALEATGGTFDGVEPVSRFHEAFQGPVDAAYAAAVVGLQTETFLERVRENTGLQNVGLLALDNENGSVKRDTWTSSFRDVMYALDYPQQVGEPPVITQPEVIPGTIVQIPDPNLRTVIAEALRKSPNAPITAEEMQRLSDLDLRDRGVRDLTGLQFATHLRWLRLSNNQVSDISPVAGIVELRELRITDNPISDIAPVRGLTNLTHLGFERCQVSDISPVRGLTKLIHLDFSHNPVADMSPVRGLTNLTRLRCTDTLVSDISPIAGLTNLTWLDMHDMFVSDLSPLAQLINLEILTFDHNEISDISPLAGLINLRRIRTWGNRFSDISPLAGLTKLEWVNICGAELSDLSHLANLTSLTELYLVSNGISDVSPLARLTGLNRLNLAGNRISDISAVSGFTNLTWLNIEDNRISDVLPLTRLTNLTWLSLRDNRISDISPLAGLTDLTWLALHNNQISDVSPLDGFRENLNLFTIFNNPVFPIGGPKIEGPWLWVFLPSTRRNLDMDLLAEASGGDVTELKIATQGAKEGNAVGSEVWESNKLPLTGRDNLDEMVGHNLPDGVIYGTVFLYSPREQNTNMFLGSDQEVKVWFNGEVIYQRERIERGGDYTDFFPVTLRRGKNVLFVAIGTRDGGHSNAFFGFEPGTEYSEATGIGYILSEPSIHIGDTFTFDVRAENVIDLAGWQFDIVFNPAVLEAVDLSEGNFLKADGGTTFFQSERINNAAGKITGLKSARLTDGGVSGTGTVLQVKFKAKSHGETRLALDNFKLGSSTGEIIPAGPHETYITIKERLPTGDVNRDGDVDILDLILVAQQLGTRVSANSPADINGDGVVNIFDLTLVAQGIGGAAAPAIRRVNSERDRALVEAWIALARLADDGSIAFRQGIANLENLLTSLIIPQETALHANYPNPFNPETWIPYQLASPAEVTLTIYDMNGSAVRRLEIGHQPAGTYQNRSRAAYWDGRNRGGEPVASGLYFYSLRAGEFTATRKMLIRK